MTTHPTDFDLDEWLAEWDNDGGTSRVASLIHDVLAANADPNWTHEQRAAYGKHVVGDVASDVGFNGDAGWLYFGPDCSGETVDTDEEPTPMTGNLRAGWHVEVQAFSGTLGVGPDARILGHVITADQAVLRLRPETGEDLRTLVIPWSNVAWVAVVEHDDQDGLPGGVE